MKERQPTKQELHRELKSIVIGFLLGQEAVWLSESLRILREKAPEAEITLMTKSSPERADGLMHLRVPHRATSPCVVSPKHSHPNARPDQCNHPAPSPKGLTRRPLPAFCALPRLHSIDIGLPRPPQTRAASF